MDRKSTTTLGSISLAVVVLLLFLSRFIHLGEVPLSNLEATHALTALSETEAASPFWPPASETAPISTSYNTSTVLIFELFGDTNATARMIAGIAGVGIVLALLILGDRLTKPRILLLSMLLLISPVLLTTSRRAGGTTLAACGMVLFFSIMLGGSGETHKPGAYRLAAVALGISIVSGPAFFMSILGFLLAILLSRFVRNGSWDELISKEDVYGLRSNIWLTVLTSILVASGLGIVQGGLQGFSESLQVWLQGWTDGPVISSWTYLVMLFLYEPFLLVFGTIGVVWAITQKDTLGIAASLWFIGALIAGLIYPGRTPLTLIWAILPLAFLSSKALVELIDRILEQKSWLEYMGLVIVFLVIVVISYLFFRGFAAGVGPTFATLDPQFSILISLTVFVLAGLIFVLFGLGWSWRLALNAGGTVLAFVTLVITFSTAWRLNYSPWVGTVQLLWNHEATSDHTELVLDTLETISIRQSGLNSSLPIKFQSPINPALAWALRDFSLFPVQELTGDQPPPAILSLEELEVVLEEGEYIGQSFVIIERTDWEGVLPPNPLNWWFRRDAPTNSERWLVLIRADLATTGEFDPRLIQETGDS